MEIIIGVLALQGAFIEHYEIFNAIDGVSAFLLRSTDDLQKYEKVHAIVLPGGESTTMGKLMTEDKALYSWICSFIRERRGLVWGTCAGMILLAKSITNCGPNQVTFDAMDIKVTRNYFGSQLHSFKSLIQPRISEIKEFSGVFIRAPIVTETLSDDVQILCEIDDPAPNSSNKVIVAVEQHNCIATSFHPELSYDDRWHIWWLDNRIKPYFPL